MSYMANAIGFTLSLNFCDDVLKSVTLYNLNKGDDDCCKSAPSDCCETTDISVDDTEDHNRVSIQTLKKYVNEEAGLPYKVDTIGIFYQPIHHTVHYCEPNGPPLFLPSKAALYLLHAVFRI